MKRISLITLILGTVLAVAPAAHAIVWSDGGSSSSASSPTLTSGMSQAEYQALMARGEALNKLYGNAVTGLSATEFRSLYQNGGNRLSPQELIALVARGDSLNKQYGTSTASTDVRDGWTNSITPSPSYTFRTDILGGDGGASTAPIPSATGDDSFAWGTVGIGAATLVGVMLLGLASLAVTRRRHQPSF
jgi:hypothetical protein